MIFFFGYLKQEFLVHTAGLFPCSDHKCPWQLQEVLLGSLNCYSVDKTNNSGMRKVEIKQAVYW